jgi:hypothetical protein
MKSPHELSWNKQCAEPVGVPYFLRNNMTLDPPPWSQVVNVKVKVKLSLCLTN